MKQRPSSVAKRFSASQEIPCILWNLKFHYSIYKSLPHVPILSQVDRVHTPNVLLPEDPYSYYIPIYA